MLGYVLIAKKVVTGKLRRKVFTLLLSMLIEIVLTYNYAMENIE